MLAQHLDDVTDRTGTLRRLFDDFNGDDLPVHRAAGLLLRHRDIVRDALVVGHHETDTALPMEASDHAVGVALQDFGHVAFETAAAVLAGDAHHHPVVVKHGVHGARRQVDIIAAGVRHQEAEAVRVGDDPARHQVELVGQGIAATPVAHQLTVPDHGVQAAAQGLAGILVMQAEPVRQTLLIDWMLRFGNDLQDEFAAGDRIFVAFRLALRLRVLQFLPVGAGFVFFSHGDGILLFMEAKVRMRAAN